MSWRTFKIILPNIPELDSARRQCRASGAVIVACGIASRRIRGLQHHLHTGKVVRQINYGDIGARQVDVSRDRLQYSR
jgi:hypothetical protein